MTDTERVRAELENDRAIASGELGPRFTPLQCMDIAVLAALIRRMDLDAICDEAPRRAYQFARALVQAGVSLPDIDPLNPEAPNG